MNKLKQAFANKRAFIPYITCGDPSLEITEQLVLQMTKAGADLIELGIPFSDPVAEGRIIQDANMRALSYGVTVDKIFDMVRNIRRTCTIPLAFMTYANPVFAYDAEKFINNCKKTEVDALIVPDLPYEEKEELEPICKKHGISLISMVSPTSDKRIQMIAKEAEGFVYCVSSMGVTGVRKDISDDVREMVKRIKEVKNIPCAVGFGISTPDQAMKISEYADGVIVGSRIVKIVEQYGSNCVPHVVEYVRMMKKAVINHIVNSQ
ncbi:MAG: tryptophan synthase subunit alpha [Clostridiaceae bacterium]|nr:tryptophan synthase subunit alpha [Clostridiaceae bacterium]